MAAYPCGARDRFRPRHGGAVNDHFGEGENAMDKIKLAIVAFGLSLALGACSNMMGDDHMDSTTMEPAAGPDSTMEGTGMTEGQMGDMEDSDDQEGASQ
jgi:hypothetical protein